MVWVLGASMSLSAVSCVILTLLGNYPAALFALSSAGFAAWLRSDARRGNDEHSKNKPRPASG